MGHKWVCQTWQKDPSKWPTEHVFDDEPDESWCPEDPQFHGLCTYTKWGDEATISIKLLENKTQFKAGNSITIVAETDVENATVEFFVDKASLGVDSKKPYTQIYVAAVGQHEIDAVVIDINGNKLKSPPIKITVQQGDPVEPEVALCVILMDASNSMGDQAFSASPLTRMQLVASTAAAGIFDLQRMHNTNAYVACFKFDDRCELMFVDTIKKVLAKHDNDVKKFSKYIFNQLDEMKQGTDLNLALKTAHSYVEQFLKKQLTDFPLKQYRVMKQHVLKHSSVETVSVPNVRVLIYTDGVQYDAVGDRTLHPNPFKVNKLAGLDEDVLIGAYFGSETDDGCRQLQGLLSKCPIHDEEQFFLFDDPSKINNLRLLFRMASGASGFCPRCLEKEFSR